MGPGPGLETRRQTGETPMGVLFNIVMRIFSTLLSLLAVLVGLVWIGQGLHVGPAAIMQGFMVNNIQWAIYGAVLALLGLGHVFWTNVRRG
jgi:hypothetical protein